MKKESPNLYLSFGWANCAMTLQERQTRTALDDAFASLDALMRDQRYPREGLLFFGPPLLIRCICPTFLTFKKMQVKYIHAIIFLSQFYVPTNTLCFGYLLDYMLLSMSL